MKKDQLGEMAIFTGISPDQLPAALEFLDARQSGYQKGEHLINIGDRWRKAGLVLTGNVEASCVIENFHKITLNHYHHGDLFDCSFAVAGANSPMQEVAINDCQVLWLRVSRLADVSRLRSGFQKQLATNLVHLLAQQGISTTMKLHVASQGNIHDKLIAYLHTLPATNTNGDRQLPFNQTELAEHLGVNRSALSRAIHQMVVNGQLVVAGKTMRVVHHKTTMY